MPMTMRKRKIMLEYDLENGRNPPPIKKNLTSKTKYKTSSGKKLNNNSASKTQGVSRSARLSLRANDVGPVRKRSTRLSLLSNDAVPVRKERRKTGVLYSLAEIHNRPIGSIRKEDPRNAMFNFSSCSSRVENAKRKLNLSLNQITVRRPAPPVSTRANRERTPPNVPTVRNRGRAGASGHGRSGGNASLISHLPDQRSFRNVAQGVSLQHSPPSGRLSIGRILMQPNASFELYEKRSSTTVYTVLKGCLTFIIENLGVSDKGKEGSLFTNTPGSTLKLRNGSAEALIAFSTFNLK